MPKYSEMTVSNFQHGYDSTKTPNQLPDNALWRSSRDVFLSKDGGVEKRKGFRKLISDASGPSWTTNQETLGMHQFLDAGNFRSLIRVARNTGTGATRVEFADNTLPGAEASVWETGGGSLGTISTSEQWCSFASYPSRLYIASPGLGQVKYLTYSSGFTVNNMSETGTTRTLDKPKGIELWYDRIWCFCAPDIEAGTYLMYSNLDGDDFDLDNDWYEVPGDGPITGIVRIGRRLMVFKPNETYVLSGGEDPVNLLQIEQVSRDVGCISQRSIITVENNVFFLAEGGFYVTDGFTLKRVSDRIEDDLLDLSRASIEKVHGVHHRSENRIVWWIPKAEGEGDGYGLTPYGQTGYGSGGINFTGYSYDYEAGAWGAPMTNQPFTVSCLYINETTGDAASAEEIVCVAADDTYDYHIYQWWYGSTDDGDTINCRIATKPYDLGSTGKIKILRRVYSRLGELGASVPVKLGLYSTMVNAGSAPDSEANIATTQGAEDIPEYVVHRSTVGLTCQQFQITYEDYNDGVNPGGRFLLEGFTILFTEKGNRDIR